MIVSKSLTMFLLHVIFKNHNILNFCIIYIEKLKQEKKTIFFLAYYLKKFEICIAQILINTNTKKLKAMRKFNNKVWVTTMIVFIVCLACVYACKKEKSESAKSDLESAESVLVESATMDLSQHDFFRVYAVNKDINGGFTFDEEGHLVGDGNCSLGYYSTYKDNRTHVTNDVALAKHFKSFVKNYDDTNDYLITCFQLVFLNDGELIQIEYVVNHDFDNPQSAMYVTNTKDAKGPVTYNVKCNGHCDSPTETCTEIFDFHLGQARCSCQSDECFMTVEIIK